MNIKIVSNLLVTFAKKEYQIEKSVLYLYNEINKTTMTTETAKRLSESTATKLLKVVEQSSVLDMLSNYALEPDDAMPEYERLLRILEAAYSELDYARDMMCAAIKEQKRQIELLKSM